MHAEEGPRESRVKNLAEKPVRRLGTGPGREAKRSLQVSAQACVHLREQNVEILRRLLGKSAGFSEQSLGILNLLRKSPRTPPPASANGARKY